MLSIKDETSSPSSAGAGHAEVGDAKECARLRQQLVDERSRHAACNSRCEDLERENSQLKCELRNQQGHAAAGGDVGKLERLEQQNTALRQRLTAVQAAMAFTQAAPDELTAQQQRRHHPRQQLLPDQQQPDQQQPQQPLQQQAGLQSPCSLSPQPAAGGDSGGLSSDTTRAVCTLPGSSPDDAGLPEPDQPQPHSGSPASPAGVRWEEPAEQRTPSSKPPRPSWTAANDSLVSANAPRRNLLLHSAVQNRLESAAGSTAAVSSEPATALTVAADNDAPIPLATLQRPEHAPVRTAATALPPHRTPAQQQQQARSWTEAPRKGWRQKRKAGDVEDLLASQKPTGRLRAQQQPSRLVAAPPRAPSLQPVVPAMLAMPPPQPAAADGLVCTPQEQQQAVLDPVQLTAPDTVAWSSPARLASAAARAEQQPGHNPAAAVAGRPLPPDAAAEPPKLQQSAARSTNQAAAAQTTATSHASDMPQSAGLAARPPFAAAQAAAAARPATRGNGPGYKFNEVVRKKAERELLQVGGFCRCWTSNRH